MSALNERARRWVFTINNYTDEDIENCKYIFENKGGCYMILGFEEAPTTGTKHIQGYIHLGPQVYRSTLNTLSRKETGERLFSYLAVAKGSEWDNYKYCSKSGNFKEYGAMGSTSEEKRSNENKTKEIMNDWLVLSPEQFDDKWPVQSLHWRRKLTDWAAARKTQSGAWNGDLSSKNIWIFGPPGTGKSMWARSQQPPDRVYCKLINKWWGGFEPRYHKVVLMEDFPQDGKYLTQQMKVWSDRYNFTGETKGGQMEIIPGRFFFIVTSNFSLDDVFEGVDLQALKRRFHEVEVKDRNDIWLQVRLSVEVLIND
uniref:Replication-associated protein n=1 Tax=Rodent circovirus TaxID=2050016 RepID=A0A2H4MZ18_9CIRC|nr:Rep [Rodent circovirus]